MADPTSKGEVVAYHAGRAVRRVVTVMPSAKAFAALIAIGIILPAIIGMAWISTRISGATYEATSSTVGPWSTDANGWTVPETTTTTSGTCGGPSATANGTCIYYVANDGTDDATNCVGYLPPVTTTPTTKCATAGFAFTRVRQGKPDWILLKRGQTFVEGANVVSRKIGQDSSHLLLFSAYPLAPVTFDDRPLLEITATPFITQNAADWNGAIISIKAKNRNFDPSSPNYWSNPVPTSCFSIIGSNRNIIIEDSDFSYGCYTFNLDSFNTRAGYNYYRRNVFWNDGPTGLAAAKTAKYTSLVVEENLFYKDWTHRSSVPISVTITAASPAVITYPFDNTVAPENGGLPRPNFFAGSTPPLVGLTGSLPTGLSAVTTNCSHSNQCYYLCNISSNTAQLSRNSNCSPIINTSGSACNVGCSSQWVDMEANVFNHHIYAGVGWDDAPSDIPTRDLTTLSGTVVRNNIFAYASATGSQARPGGVIYNNLYYRNPIQITCCAWPSDISYNMILAGSNMQRAINSEPYGFGMEISSYRCAAEGPVALDCPQDFIDNPPTDGSNGTRIHHNILAKSEATGGNGQAIRLFPYNKILQPNGWMEAVNGVTLESNIVCDWATAGNKPYDDQGTNNTLATSNKPNPQTSNVDTTCAALGIVAPATVGDYYVSIGGPGGSTTDDFLAYCMLHWTKISWKDECMAMAANAYIRPTYGITNPPASVDLRIEAR